MKPLAVAFAALLIGSLPALSQEAERPANDPTVPSGLGLEPAPLPPLEPSKPVESLPLIPETPTPTEKPKGTALTEPKDKEKKSKTEIAADEMRERVRYREARTKALRDPKVVAEWEIANSAKTDLEKREALKRYYKLLYARMVKLDGTLKKRAADAEVLSLRRLEQNRIDPTEPIDPDERGFREQYQ